MGEVGKIGRMGLIGLIGRIGRIGRMVQRRQRAQRGREWSVAETRLVGRGRVGSARVQSLAVPGWYC